MKIILYGLNYAPEPTGIGKYSGDMARWLVERGHAVTVIAAPPYYPDWRVWDGFSAWRYASEDAGRLKVFRCPLWVPRGPGGLKRVLHLLSFAATSLPRLIREAVRGADLIFVVEPPLACLPAGLVAGRLTGARVWLHVQDFEVDAAFRLGLLRAGWLRRLAGAFERLLLRGVDRASTISPAMDRVLGEKGVESDRRTLFPNWVDTEAIFPLAAPPPLRAELGIDAGQIVVLYAGSIGKKQGIEALFEAARVIGARREDILFVVCGRGAEYDAQRQAFGGLTNVRWVPLQPEARLNELLNLADIHVLPQRRGAADIVMPSKLTGMLASGRPTVATAEPGSDLHAAVRGRGVVVPPEDAEALAEAILKLADEPALRAELGAAARALALENFGREAVLRRLEEAMMALAPGATHELKAN